jgi:hypothetical protein
MRNVLLKHILLINGKTARFIIKSEDDAKKLVFIIANFFIAKGKIEISNFLKLKNYINILVQIVHVVYQYIIQSNINKIIQRNKNKSTQF